NYKYTNNDIELSAKPLPTGTMTITAEREEYLQSDDEFRDDWDFRIHQNNVPVLSNIIRNHTLPPTANSTARFLWELDQEKTTHLPQFVDKALKLLNLKQVTFEIENSVMSKVSCTACRTGAGLLQHYTKMGKSEKEIKKTIYQFCVNLKIQSPRVCEGITELFAGEVIYVLGKVKIGPEEICSFVIGDACGDIYNPYHEWEVMFPPVPKPTVIEQKIPETAKFAVGSTSQEPLQKKYEGRLEEISKKLVCLLSTVERRCCNCCRAIGERRSRRNLAKELPELLNVRGFSLERGMFVEILKPPTIGAREELERSKFVERKLFLNGTRCIPVNAPTFKVLHLSDTHYDPYYMEGSNADCAEPLCCRFTNGPAANKESAAGKWGDYRKCDSPKVTVDNMLQHIQETHPDIDYIIWTGDLPPHDIWNQTREENLKILKDTVKQMSDMFPGAPIFPALGNHESAPVNR
ncbi:hypothetical protein NQ318_016017, partial [Aromia moschata]